MAKAKAQTPPKMGRPTTYTEEIADRICSEHRAGRPLYKICEDEWAPPQRTVYDWLADHKEFSQKLHEAKRHRATALLDQVERIANLDEDDAELSDRLVAMEDKDRNTRDKMRMGHLEWQAKKGDPEKYGDSMRNEVSGQLDTGSAAEDLVRLATETAFALRLGHRAKRQQEKQEKDDAA